MGVIWTAYIVVFIHRLSIGPLSPFLKSEWDLSSTQVGALVSAAVFGSMASVVLSGWLVDRFGIRRILLIGELIAGTFMLVMYQAPSYQVALILMGCTGFGCGFLQPATTKGVLVWFPRNERALIMGIKQTAVNVGGMITAAVLPTLALAAGWRLGFLIIGFIAIGIGVMSYTLYKEPPRSSVPSSDSNKEISSSAPPPDKASVREIFKSRDIWLVALASFSIVTVEFGVLAHLVLYLTEDLLFPVVTAGAILALTEGGGILGKPLSGVLSDRVFQSSRRKVFMMWAGVACVTSLLIAVFGSALGPALYPILFIFGICGIGWGGINLTLVGELAGVELAGRVTSINSLINSCGVALGPILFGYLVDTTGDYQPAWFLCVGLTAICVTALLFVREERRRI